MTRAFAPLRRVAVLALGILAPGVVALSACQKQIEPPYETGVCYHMVPLTGGQVKFNVLAQNRPSLESCAAALEGMRERFLGLGGNQTLIVGAYQGTFLFLDKTGVFTGKTLTGARYPALVRTPDGRLAIPSAVSQ